MEKKFKRDVSESLKRLHFVLMKKAKNAGLSQAEFQKSMEYLNALQMVAGNAGAYCNPAYFNKNMRKLGFDIATNFSLFSLDERAAQCVYDIMVCRRDYIYYGDEVLCKMYKFDAYRYKSQEEVIAAMRLFKRDSIQIAGGFVPCTVRSLMDSVFCKGK